MKNLRTEVVSELSECLQNIKSTGFVFLPKFEKTMAKVELFQERVKSPTINDLLILLKGQLVENSYPETRVSKKWIENLQKLLHFVENIVPLSPEE